MNTILCIDTASDHFALAVIRGRHPPAPSPESFPGRTAEGEYGVVETFEAEAKQDHSRLLLPAISELLAEDVLDAILVVTGPGAYAGIRVGIATAEGLALARGVPLYGVGTLEAAALAARITDGTVVHPAGRGEFAMQRVEAGAMVGTPAIAAPATLALAKPAGEGASSLGGKEVSSRERVEAALRDRAPKIRSGSLATGAEAFYLREPNITVSRRYQTAAS